MKNASVKTDNIASAELPLYLFHQGTNFRAYEFFGSHIDGDEVTFRVWAPNAEAVSVVGDFNGWNASADRMRRISDQGVWETTVKGLKVYDNYKYAVVHGGRTVLKTDPFAVHNETTPQTASKVYDLGGYKWRSEEYDIDHKSYQPYDKPLNIYEVNLASWKKNADGSYYSYRQLAETLVPYVKKMGYTHVEFMPITEYPYDGSWGYQVTGYFAVSSRFGTPHDFMALVDEFHLAGIGVIVDWVPAHFPKDENGLYEFDGTCQYEDFRPKRMEHKSWGTRIFDFGKTEIQSFLVSSATFFFETYHIDGIRVDAVASMLYLDYDRRDGEWELNSLGTNINLEAVAFLQKLNSAIFGEFPYALMIAEESTAFPMVTKPVAMGGLGFNYKWNMGWMNDVLSYCVTDPLWRGERHDRLTFSMMYAFSENFILPISHDEVVYGKGSLINKMPGDYDAKFAGVRAFMGYMMAHPGKKLMFMGQELGQFDEWNFNQGIGFDLLGYPKHAALNKFFADLNAFYRENAALHSIECSWDGFEWINADDRNNNMLGFIRRGNNGQEIVAVINFSGLPHDGYELGVGGKKYRLAFTSDLKEYGGEGKSRKRIFRSSRRPMHGKPRSLKINIRPLSFMYLERCE